MNIIKCNIDNQRLSLKRPRVSAHVFSRMCYCDYGKSQKCPTVPTVSIDSRNGYASNGKIPFLHTMLNSGQCTDKLAEDMRMLYAAQFSDKREVS